MVTAEESHRTAREIPLLVARRHHAVV